MPTSVPPGSSPIVGIVMGSASDLPTMRKAADSLQGLGIPCEIGVCSAHRNTLAAVEYSRSAAARGLKVIIAGAGGAAHLPGVLAAVTTLPVIGVPIGLKNLDGLDSLLSIVQMPSGVPVATVSIDGAANAGLLAARILGVGDTALTDRLQAHHESLIEASLAQDAKVASELAAE